MAESSIDWTDKVWNPVVGCAKVSAGCKNCYAETMAARCALMSAALGRESVYLPVVDTAKRRWNGRAEMVPARLADPLKWKKPRRVFVNSMSDLFHEDVTFEFVAACFGVMAATPQHTYQILTKRPERMLAFFEWACNEADKRGYGQPEVCMDEAAERGAKVPTTTVDEHGIDAWPLPNVWLGVSTEDQATADERIPLLLQAPAAVRFLSCEPLLGPIDLSPMTCHRCGSHEASFTAIDDRTCSQPWCVECDLEMGDPVWLESLGWIIAGGESGPGARPCDLAWIRKIVGQCAEAEVACFVKQLGANPRGVGHRPLLLKGRKGADPNEWPEDLRVRQYPEAP